MNNDSQQLSPELINLQSRLEKLGHPKDIFSTSDLMVVASLLLSHDDDWRKRYFAGLNAQKRMFLDELQSLKAHAEISPIVELTRRIIDL